MSAVKKKPKSGVLPRLVHCLWLTIMLYQILFFFCMNFVLNCHESHVKMNNIAFSIWKLCPQTLCCCASPTPLVQYFYANMYIQYTAYTTAATHRRLSSKMSRWTIRACAKLMLIHCYFAQWPRPKLLSLIDTLVLKISLRLRSIL